ncbi:MAG: hypothetical protein ACOVP7_02615 [Lacibacter sp.]
MIDLTQRTLEIHIALFAVVLLLTALIGFLYGRKKIKAKEKRILELEDEMLAGHREILQYAEANKQLKETLEKAKIPYPVTRIDEEGDEKVRKIPLGKIG